ncbi:HAMP domain-containing sensor histidine kinase [Peribacillus frigoritolerans]|jgi:signal transduction histidine kinase|nr:HAMP domain-containing sensor histidine kinase [Peribacillus frigoritolerans]MCD1162978.1 HAMP domain-containing histidine kinase [Peribacillus castrilensis]MCK2020808.1 HAMP domain-containing histidine kinase [Peribacillus frigoritolerans]MDF1996750.1 HAMP domain-containing sensor histidine kinase [Peribacillus frigoritolerans]MED3761333.1 HAMP domain-containing sensor histidine kinase [Peribacillus frigoritolerans]WHX62802.1 HAMP domain-containing sensor histidine kinase [Peribacillus fri
MAMISFLLLVGISVSPISWKDNPYEMTLQVILISGMIISLLFFLKTEVNFYKTLFIFLITVYFYSKFWIFPDTAIMLALFAIAPLFPIFLFDKIGFYIVATLNIILGPASILIISKTDLQHTYEYVALDSFGNTLNFIAIQIILVFVFIGTNNRMESNNAFHKEIQQAKQLNSVGQLAATIAHEIRNPITVVKGFAQLLDQEKELNETEKFYVQTMLTELEYTQVIINDYLSLAKPQTDNVQVIPLNDEIQKISDLLTSFANNRNIGFLLDFRDDLHINMNPIELKQILVNIMKNGIESMNKPGFIKVETEQERTMAKIRITDTGIGLSKEQLEILGTPFYSLKDRGTGIGLTVCYSIVQKYKGKIVVQSEVNKGTSFTIYLPLYKEID